MLFFTRFLWFSYIFWKCFWPRQKLFQKIGIFIIHMFWYLCQQIFEILTWFQLVYLCCFSYTVDDRRTVGSINGINHLPVLLSDAESLDGPFTGIIIHWNIPVFKKYPKISFSIHGISKSRLRLTAFLHTLWILFQVRKESIHQWFYHQLTLGSPFIRWQSRKLSFLTADSTYLVHDQVQNGLLSHILWYDLQCLMGLAPAMYPAFCDHQVFFLFFKGMIDLISVCYTDTRIIFQKFLRTGNIACFLVFIQDDLFFRVHKTRTVYPHPALAADSTSVFIQIYLEDGCCNFTNNAGWECDSSIYNRPQKLAV